MFCQAQSVHNILFKVSSVGGTPAFEIVAYSHVSMTIADLLTPDDPSMHYLALHVTATITKPQQYSQHMLPMQIEIHYISRLFVLMVASLGSVDLPSTPVSRLFLRPRRWDELRVAGGFKRACLYTCIKPVQLYTLLVVRAYLLMKGFFSQSVALLIRLIFCQLTGFTKISRAYWPWSMFLCD